MIQDLLTGQFFMGIIIGMFLMWVFVWYKERQQNSQSTSKEKRE